MMEELTRRKQWRERAILAALAIFLSSVVAAAWSASPFAQALAGVGVFCACVHCIRSYGFINASAFFLICNVVSFGMENLGVATGWPFGWYHFVVGADFIRIGRIPLIVGGLWFGMGYFAWRVAAIILDDADKRLANKLNLIALPILAAMIMTQWDLVMDPPSSTLSHQWIWHDGGGVFGVPISNFFGWLLNSWLFFQAFALYMRLRPEWERGSSCENLMFRLIPVLFYLASGLTHFTPWLLGERGQVADSSGWVWRIEDVRGSAAIMMILTMGATSLIAVVKLLQNQKAQSQN